MQNNQAAKLNIERTEPVPRKRHRSRNPIVRDQRRLAFLFITPWVIGFLGLHLYPILSTFYYSFMKYNFFQSPKWVGLANYEAMFRSSDFLQALYNTIYYAIFGVAIQLLVGLGTAMLLNLKVRGQTFYRTIYFLPAVMPPIAAGMLWMWMLNPEYGLVNAVIEFFGIDGPVWLIDPAWTKPAVIMMAMWGVGTTTIIFLAGLGDVPRPLYEAMDMDGGGAWAKFRHITLPMISPITYFLTINGFIAAFSLFAPSLVFTSGQTSVGGPSNSLLFYSVYIYQQAFQFLEFGYASALAWVLFLLIMLITGLVHLSSKIWLHYEGK